MHPYRCPQEHFDVYSMLLKSSDAEGFRGVNVSLHRASNLANLAGDMLRPLLLVLALV
jgi:hypothetical protein